MNFLLIIFLCPIFGINSELLDFDILKNQNNCLCDYTIQPLCASNYITYGNLCSFDCAAAKNSNLMVLYYGKCEQNSCESYWYPKPVCGSDHRTYNNLCTLEWVAQKVKSLKLKHEGRCRQY